MIPEVGMHYLDRQPAIRYAFIPSAFTMVLLFGCASSGSSHDGTASVAYGEVTRLKRVESQSGYGAGVLLGGALGLGLTSAAGTTTQIAGASGGSMSGGAAQRKMKQAKYVSKYSIRMNDGENLEIVTDNSDVHAGDCVAVERGETTNISSVSASMCEDRLGRDADSVTRTANTDEAADCDQAGLARSRTMKSATGYRGHPVSTDRPDLDPLAHRPFSGSHGGSFAKKSRSSEKRPTAPKEWQRVLPPYLHDSDDNIFSALNSSFFITVSNIDTAPNRSTFGNFSIFRGNCASPCRMR